MQVHGRLCGFLERGDAFIMGDTQKWIPHCIKVFGAVIGTPSVDAELTERVKNLLVAMRAQMPDLVNASVSALPPADMQKLSALVA